MKIGNMILRSSLVEFLSISAVKPSYSDVPWIERYGNLPSSLNLTVVTLNIFQKDIKSSTKVRTIIKNFAPASSM